MEVYLKDKLINVNIIRKKNKNIYFRFDENLNLNVTANKYISTKEITKLIAENEKSLTNMLNKVTVKQTKSKEFWYLGAKYNLIINENLSEIAFQDGKLYTPSLSFLDKFLKTKTFEIFNREVNNLKKVIKTPDFTLKIRQMKTRCGVCNYKSMTVTLYSELIKYRLDMLRYVIIHEMCHFYHNNHGPEFWSLVAKYYPEYKEARKELRT